MRPVITEDRIWTSIFVRKSSKNIGNSINSYHTYVILQSNTGEGKERKPAIFCNQQNNAMEQICMYTLENRKGHYSPSHISAYTAPVKQGNSSR